MSKETRTAWTVAGVLGVLVIILLGVLAYMWYQREHDLGYVIQDSRDAVLNQQAQVREKCTSEAGEQSPACQAAIEQLMNVLEDVSTDLNRIRSATTSDIGGQ